MDFAACLVDTIFAYANGCLGLKSKNVFILRVNLSPDGRNQWEFHMILPNFSMRVTLIIIQ